MSPQRIQRRRTAGWRMPEGAVYVGRPSRWGNCFVVRGQGPSVEIVTRHHPTAALWYGFATREAATAHAVRAFRWQLEHHPNVTGFTVDDVRAQLAGRDLACWCPTSWPCHADVLLDVANGPRQGKGER